MHNFKIIRTNFLRDIREDLLDVDEEINTIPRNDIVYITAEIEDIETEIMIDTGSNISLINQIELNRIQEISGKNIPLCRLPT